MWIFKLFPFQIDTLKKGRALCLGVVMVGILALAGCSSASQSGTIVEKPTPPAPYASKINPFSGQADAAAAGKTIYQTNCMSCHGETGTGDGPAAPSLNPKPANLALMSPAADTDAYIFWRVSEGGGFPPFNSAMPAWKSVLNTNQIWQVVTYLRTIEK